MTVLSQLDDVERLVDELLLGAFRELALVRPEVITFEHRKIFFRSRPRFLTFLWPFARLRYVIAVNPLVLGELPTPAARGILAHELGHTASYERRGRRAILVAAWSLVNPRFRRFYERRVDLEAIFRGHAAGLADYRRWMEESLEPDDFAGRIRFYYTAEEIEWLDRQLVETPALRDRWSRRPPLRPEPEPLPATH